MTKNEWFAIIENTETVEAVEDAEEVEAILALIGGVELVEHLDAGEALVRLSATNEDKLNAEGQLVLWYGPVSVTIELP